MRTVPLVYMDLCAWKRPLDRQDEERVRLETEAVLSILAASGAGKVHLASSSVLFAENARNPVRSRKEKAEELLKRSKLHLLLTDGAWKRAEALSASGFSPADSLHLAVAIESGADAFVTTDADLLRRAARSAVPVRVLNPILLAEEITHETR